MVLFGSRARGEARPESDVDLLLLLRGTLTPEREALWRRRVRALLLPLLPVDPAFAQENWGFLAQQCVENLLKGLIVLADQSPPLSHDLVRLQILAGACLPASGERLLALMGPLRAVLEARIGQGD